MAKLYFYYSAMNAGKTTTLLQSSYNYRERGMDTLLYVPRVDVRYGSGKITSRIGLASEAVIVDDHFDFFKEVSQQKEVLGRLACVLVDEAQFLKKEQVIQLCKVVDDLRVPVLTYGIRTDFRGETFEGSHALLALAEELAEIKTICHCGRKATMNIRMDDSGKRLREGEQVQVGGNERYVSVCRRHFF